MATAHTMGFRLLPSYYEALRDLPDEERLLLYDAIFDYGFGHEVGALTPLSSGYFSLIKPSLEKSVRYFAKQHANGERGGRPKNPNETQTKPKHNPNETQAKPNGNRDSDSEGDSESEKGWADKPPRSPRFAPPTVEEVRAYCTERKNRVDPERFVDFYASKGWLVGKSRMKDWKAAVRNWERQDSQQTPPASLPVPPPPAIVIPEGVPPEEIDWAAVYGDKPRQFKDGDRWEDLIQ